MYKKSSGSLQCRTSLTMRSISILSLLIVEIVTEFSALAQVPQNDSIITLPRSQRQEIPRFLLNPEQMEMSEKTIERFLSNVAGSNELTLQLVSYRSPQRIIGEICRIIRQKLMEFARASGLISSVHQYERSLSEPSQTEDWFSEALLQGSRLLCDLGRMINEASSSVNVYLQKGNEQYATQMLKRDKSLGKLDSITEFNDKLSQCLKLLKHKKKNRRSFDLIRAFANSTKGSLRSTARTFGSSLENTFLELSSTDSSKNPVILFLCRFLTNRNHYQDCMREIKHFENCLYSRKRNTDMNNDNKGSWLNAVQDLSDCKFRMNKDNVVVDCKRKRRLPRSPDRQIKYIYEKMLDRRIQKRSPLNRVARDLGRVVSESVWGKQFVDELCQYAAIYEDGRRKAKRLSKISRQNKKAAARYNKVSESLKSYRKGLVVKTVRAVRKVHGSAVELEKLIVDGIKVALNETWQSHTRILSCMTEWMTKLLELYGLTTEIETDTEFTTTDTPSTTETYDDSQSNSKESLKSFYDSNEFKNSLAVRSKTDIQRDVDRSFEKLLNSMNHVSRVEKRAEKSTLAYLANNLLLVTMFMETISLISSLFCLSNNNTNESKAAETREDWGRTRRELLDKLPETFNLIHTENLKMKIKVQENMIFNNKSGKKKKYSSLYS